LGQVFAINLPASAGLAFLAQPIIQLLFEYGRFSSSDTHATAVALMAYSLGLTAYSAVKVLVPACYALGNTRIPVISSACSVAVNIGLNLIMIRPFGYWGLALGTSVTAFLNAGFLITAVRALLKKAGGEFPVMPLVRGFLIHTGLAVTMGGICWESHRFLAQFLADPAWISFLGKAGIPMVRALKVGLACLEGGILIIVLAQVFKVRDTVEVFDKLLHRFKKTC
jgi:putative peptidoglycan lipid II flippase